MSKTLMDPVVNGLRQALLHWYKVAHRSLPWRERTDPYRVWLSEIMLQQTRVDQALPYFERFLIAFPNVAALAGADLTEVLQVWEGLGYYRRAHNLHRAAQQVHAQGWPQDYKGWRALPGVGEYTGRALAAILLQEPTGAVDGNVRRVYSRLLAQGVWTGHELQTVADQWVDPVQPGDFNQALMDLGATICLPRQPRCLLCPIQQYCQGLAQNRVEEFPVRVRKPVVPRRRFLVVVSGEPGTVLIRQRPTEGLLGGLWELPNQEVAAQIVLGRPVGGLTPHSLLCTIQHRYTHFHSTLEVYRGELSPALSATCLMVPQDKLPDYPFSKGFRKVLAQLS
ncbi:A/G-specific adenine glycosylase [Anthocerotibacter panamensis]|uniref:A/G-specific adenine glycosylase n=1 Tax=Anthocerotibacter panamensis TaxID=2857077 RepID=UPI001C4083AC|nr:A/G-specific adenine glycosylase [Anthocerotibacter panamensis]